MSELVVEVCEVLEVKEHPGAVTFRPRIIHNDPQINIVGAKIRI